MSDIIPPASQNSNQNQLESVIKNGRDLEISPTRFMIYIGLGLLTLALIVVGLGAVLTQYLWPTQEKLSHPVLYQER